MVGHFFCGSRLSLYISLAPVTTTAFSALEVLKTPVFAPISGLDSRESTLPELPSFIQYQTPLRGSEAL